MLNESLKCIIFFVFQEHPGFFSVTGASLLWPVIYLYYLLGVQIFNFGNVMGLEIAKLVS